ncbi:MAG TPA: GGDEF domain-containing protein [Gemmatimonadaceae bacterium]|jgi:diguanylate cyclase (GGDEF)-like protein|nr:GGDEF domain-containing protein [Gemmatimonadaceae bacterium]
MASPNLIQRDDDPMALNPPTMRVTQELPMVSVELGEALLAEQASLRREVLMWQRWVRYLALGAMVLLSLLYSSTMQAALTPLALLASGYIGVVFSTAWILDRSSSRAAQSWIPSLLLTADIAALAGFIYLTSAPEQFHRILLLGFLSMQLGVFYFGRAHGTLAALLTIAAYLLFAAGVPAFVPGPRPPAVDVAFDVTLFALISAVLIYTFGSFRERMDALRMYCKVVERGEVATLPQLGAERWPDELTLLARSFQAMHARLAEQIGSDPLTGCMNRRSLEARLRSDLRQARRRGSTVAVVGVDLDHFKEINDTRGHPVGDIVLQQLAGIMKVTARDTDSVARFGGDEFVILLPDTGWQGALTFAERLRRCVDDYSFGPPDTPVTTTISVGVALGRGSEATSADALLKEADTALYKAKTAGRNRVFS